MADKAATVYIVDLGKDMGKKHSGRDESDLDFALRYVWDKITSTVANGRKTDTVGVLGLRTDGRRGTPNSKPKILICDTQIPTMSRLLMMTTLTTTLPF